MNIYSDICGMSSTVRQQKFSRLILREMSDIFQQDKRGILNQIFISIAEVRTSPDLGVAKVYISMMLQKDKQAVLDKLNAHKGEFRKALGNRIRNQVRIIPELIFYIDEVEENAMRLDQLIDSLDIPPTKPDDKEKN